MSAVLDASGRRVIEASEMVRVFGDQFRAEPEEDKSEEGGPSKQFQEMQSLLTSQYEQRIHDLKEVNEQLFSRLEDAHHTTKLLESRFAEKEDWEALLESRIAAVVKEQREEVRLWRSRAYQERDKTWWQKLLQKKSRVGDGSRK
ncbi:MAG: hypothetical protein AAGD11_07600 [Planctomycetota bacterium]